MRHRDLSRNGAMARNGAKFRKDGGEYEIIGGPYDPGARMSASA
jgi:hypothetical protein